MPRAAPPSTTPSPTPSILRSCTCASKLLRGNTMYGVPSSMATHQQLAPSWVIHDICCRNKSILHTPVVRGSRNCSDSARRPAAADLFLLGSLHSKSVVQGCRGNPTADGPQHATGPTQDAKVAQEAQSHSHQLPLHRHLKFDRLLWLRCLLFLLSSFAAVPAILLSHDLCKQAVPEHRQSLCCLTPNVSQCRSRRVQGC